MCMHSCTQPVGSKLYILIPFISLYKQIRIKMQDTHIVNQDQMYVQFTDSGQTKLVGVKDIQSGFSYRRVHYTHEGEWRNNRSSGEVFSDPQYKIDKQELSTLDAKCSKVILKRLYDLYNQSTKKKKLEFFPSNETTVKRIKDHKNLPPFSTEIGIFPISHYKSLFLTQDFVWHGLYEIIINQNGRFETDVVDDWIPVNKDTLQPIWGMTIENAWQIILLKFWAKKNGSYYKIKEIPPFQFIQFFSNSNWKYFNLQKEGIKFLQSYKDKIQFGKFILKTKDTQQVSISGLVRNSAGYQMIDLKQVKKQSSKQFVLAIASTMINKWSGRMSVLDKQANNKFDFSKYHMKLQRDFMISDTDFINLFSSVYVASKRNKSNYFSDYYLLNIPAQCKNALYLKFSVQQQGWFDFCVKQFEENRAHISSDKNSNQNKYNNSNKDNKRYLKTKIILVRDNESGRQLSYQYASSSDYNVPRFDVYDVAYQQGYNKGDALYLNIGPGTYYLRIKIEKVIHPTKFVVNYSSDSRITMQEVLLSKQMKSQILRTAMASLISEVSRYSLSKDSNYQQITFADLYEHVGYGFVGVRMKKSCPYKLLIEIDPHLIKKSGYKLKNQFKTLTEPFSIVVQNGECTSVVLNRVDPNAQWPPQGIDIFKQKK